MLASFRWDAPLADDNVRTSGDLRLGAGGARDVEARAVRRADPSDGDGATLRCGGRAPITPEAS